MIQNSSSSSSVCLCVCVQQKKRMKQEGSCVVRGRQEEQMAWQSMGRGRNPPTLWPTFIDEPECVSVCAFECVCVCVWVHVLDTYAITQYYLEQHHPDYFKFTQKDGAGASLLVSVAHRAHRNQTKTCSWTQLLECRRSHWTQIESGWLISPFHQNEWTSQINESVTESWQFHNV